MTQFLGTHVNKLDRKGRVSVPASFRAALERLGTSEIIFRPSHRHLCIEGWPLPAFEKLAASMEQMDAFSEDEDDMATSLFAFAHSATPDGEGRLVLPEAMIAHAGLSDTVAFVGLGRNFQLWDPVAAQRRAEEARLRARERGLSLPGQRIVAPPMGGGRGA